VVDLCLFEDIFEIGILFYGDRGGGGRATGADGEIWF
jgi:hypothetical protein